MRRMRRDERKEAPEENKENTKKAARKRATKLTTLAMEIAESKGVYASTAAARQTEIAEAKDAVVEGRGCAEAKETVMMVGLRANASSAATPASVVEVVADMVMSVACAEVATPVVRQDLSRGAPSSRQQKRKRALQASSGKRRRGILQEDDDADDEVSVMLISPNIRIFINMVSNKIYNILFEPEDDESDGDSWTDDWDTGHLTDEEPEQEAEELPDSIWLSAAKGKRLIASMRDNGWEYDPAKFGEDPEYHVRYDGPYGPSDSVLSLADDPIALLFYFMPPPPKLWSQIAVESNTYHKQSIPARARGIRDHQ
ncbi:unnamed protein product [Phytophthora fragariaefolia]|uniref:Unnamed protein product n=1 Tax=Phytophthora fragariaefolia TaxID=1490495 RepID=A0A9W6XF59_9STRA|nr:unnamed protein product [Phytophthora fragariaefolia]